MRIVIAGSASRMSHALLPTLMEDERIDQVIGLDQREAKYEDARYTQVLLDLRSPQIARVISGADALINLTLVEDDTVDITAADREHRVLGGENVFRCAAAERVPCLVHLSSAAVYELPARERPITEEHPRAALRGIALAEDQATFEAWLDKFEIDNTDTRIVRLRPHFMIGTRAARSNRAVLSLPFCPRLTSPPRMQCVHESDVLRAISLALFRNVDGAFNLACANTATLREMQRRRGGGWIPLPLTILRLLLRLLRRFTPAPHPAWLEATRHDIVLDTSRARRRLGWKPQYDSIAACLRAIE